jgi:hypothetical protein
LKHTDILASISPFYHRETKLLHLGGRIGMGGSGRLDRKWMKLCQDVRKQKKTSH